MAMAKPPGFGKFQPKGAAPAAAPAPAAPKGFGGGARPAPGKPVGGAPAGKKSLWEGVKSSKPRTPMLEAPEAGGATYRVRVLECMRGYNEGKDTESLKSRIEVFAADGPTPVGTECMFVEGISGKQRMYGPGRFKGYVVAAAGFEDDDSYDAFAITVGDDGKPVYFVDAVLGDANGYTATIVGRLVDVYVTRGNPDNDGGYFRNYTWHVVAEEEQDQVPAVGAQ